eukprot:2636811-Pleurochrysis_carterae.AAC.1
MSRTSGNLRLGQLPSLRWLPQRATTRLNSCLDRHLRCGAAHPRVARALERHTDDEAARALSASLLLGARM